MKFPKFLWIEISEGSGVFSALDGLLLQKRRITEVGYYTRVLQATGDRLQPHLLLRFLPGSKLLKMS